MSTATHRASPPAPWLRLASDGPHTTAHLAGRWRIVDLPQIEAALAGLRAPGTLTVDASELEQLRLLLPAEHRSPGSRAR